MTNSWQEHRSASFRLQPIQLHQFAKVLLALPSFGSASSLSADSRGAPPTSSGATSRDRPQSHLHQPSARRLRSGRIALSPNPHGRASFPACPPADTLPHTLHLAILNCPLPAASTNFSPLRQLVPSPPLAPGHECSSPSSSTRPRWLGDSL